MANPGEKIKIQIGPHMLYWTGPVDRKGKAHGRGEVYALDGKTLVFRGFTQNEINRIATFHMFISGAYGYHNIIPEVYAGINRAPKGGLKDLLKKNLSQMNSTQINKLIEIREEYKKNPEFQADNMFNLVCDEGNPENGLGIDGNDKYLIIKGMPHRDQDFYDGTISPVDPVFDLEQYLDVMVSANNVKTGGSMVKIQIGPHMQYWTGPVNRKGKAQGRGEVYALDGTTLVFRGFTENEINRIATFHMFNGGLYGFPTMIPEVYVGMNSAPEGGLKDLLKKNLSKMNGTQINKLIEMREELKQKPEFKADEMFKFVCVEGNPENGVGIDGNDKYLIFSGMPHGNQDFLHGPTDPIDPVFDLEQYLVSMVNANNVKTGGNRK